MKKKILFGVTGFLVAAIAGVFIYFQLDFLSGSQRVDQYYKDLRVEKIRNIGATKTLEILPLVDWYTDRGELKGEAGLSYLVKTDEAVILFDLGLNAHGEDPSPLLHNMNKCGVDIGKIDAIVISHKHVDHVGGFDWVGKGTFSLGNRQIDLGKRRVYAPVPMTYPGLDPVTADQPTVISKGVITTGTLPRYLFFAGWTPEQALAIKVEGKGIVLIVGCGHQTVNRLLERARQMFDEPIVGIVGGLHYPVTDSRVKVLGLPIQQLFGTGKPPWSSITKQEVSDTITLLQKLNPRIVALSAHDSCDESLAAFRSAFPAAFREIRVGKKLEVGS